MTDRPFLIAGGGIAGLAAAIGLRRIGRNARVFEQAPAFEEVGAGLQMSPNAVGALQWLGAWEAVEPSCVIPTEIHVRDGRSGGILQRIRLGKPFEERFGAPYRVCHRADLLAALLQVAEAQPGVELNTGAPVQSSVSTPEGARLTLASGAVMEGAAVIGADGIHSKVREAVCGPIALLTHGHALFRALLPLALVPPAIETDCVTLWLCPGGHVVHYPVSNWRNFNVVAAIDGPAKPGVQPRDSFADMDETLSALLAAPDSWLSWPLAVLPDLPQWSNGNVVLTGDAAHATLPYLAQGAAMALEDACSLSLHVNQAGDPATAFLAHAESRRSRTARVQAESRRLAGIYHAAGLAAVARNLAMTLMGKDAAIRRNAWIYGWKP